MPWSCLLNCQNQLTSTRNLWKHIRCHWHALRTSNPSYNRPTTKENYVLGSSSASKSQRQNLRDPAATLFLIKIRQKNSNQSPNMDQMTNACLGVCNSVRIKTNLTRLSFNKYKTQTAKKLRLKNQKSIREMKVMWSIGAPVRLMIAESRGKTMSLAKNQEFLATLQMKMKMMNIKNLMVVMYSKCCKTSLERKILISALIMRQNRNQQNI